MKGDYVRKVGATFRVAGTRISLDSIVYAFREGQSAESIAENYPTLMLEQVYGALALYLRAKGRLMSTCGGKHPMSEPGGIGRLTLLT